MRLCYYCSLEQPEEAFAPSARRFHGGREVGRCKTCSAKQNRQWRERNPEKCKVAAQKRRNDPVARERDRKKGVQYRYGISHDDYDAMRVRQGYKCAICGLSERDHKLSRWGNLCVDHDHKTGKIRALLCATCNKGLGAFKDNPDWLRSAAAYLEEHNNGH